MPYSYLNERLVIDITGNDRISFLQGLITNDAARLSAGQAIYAALLTPQGKFLHDFLLVPNQDHILLDIHKDRAEDLLARFKKYKLRAAVSFELTSMPVYAVWNEAIASNNAITDPRLAELGTRIYGDYQGQKIKIGDYEAHRIFYGIPDGAKDMHIDKSLLLEFDFESLNGVSFSKGCYVGQEVTARSKFRGQVRKQIVQIQASSDLPPLGTELIFNGDNVGELRSTCRTQGLALLKTDVIEQNNAQLLAGSIEVTYRRPSWRRPI